MLKKPFKFKIRLPKCNLNIEDILRGYEVSLPERNFVSPSGQVMFCLERFSVECCKTKTKVITLANHKEHTQYSERIKTRSNYR